MAIKETVEIDVKTNADKTADDLTSAIRDLQSAIEKMTGSMNDGFSEANKNISKVDEGVQDIGDSAKNSEKGVKTLSKGFRGMGAAMKAAGIGLVIEGLNILKELFGENQIVVDAFNTAFEFLSIAFNDFVNFIVSNTGAVTGFFKGIFENPKKALLDFADAFKRNIQERFESYLDTLGYLASAVKKVFSGDFKGALQDVKSAGKESLDVLTGVNNTFDKGKEAITKVATATKDYVVQTAKAAKETVELNKAAELSDSIRQGLIEKYDLEAEKLRQVRDDERQTIADRIKANEELGAVLDKQEAEMMAAAQTRLAAAEREAEKKKGNLEAEKALIEAQNELAGVQAQVAGFRSEQLMNEMSLQRELFDLEMLRKENALEVSNIYRDTLLELETNAQKRLDLEEEFNRKRYEQELKLLEEKKSLYNQGTQAYADAEAEIYTLNANRTAQERLEAKKRREIEQQTQQAKLQMTGNAISAINDLAQSFLEGNEEQAEKSFKINKALGISQAVVNTAQAVTAALTAGGNPIKLATGAQFVEAGIAAVTGAAQIATIARQQFEASGSIDTNIGGGVAAPSITPQFNVVGASGTNQIAQSLRQQGPLRAYVVGSDVSSQQEMDRKRVKNATL